jgi:hypothetical protein
MYTDNLSDQLEAVCTSLLFGRMSPVLWACRRDCEEKGYYSTTEMVQRACEICRRELLIRHHLGRHSLGSSC